MAAKQGGHIYRLPTLIFSWSKRYQLECCIKRLIRTWGSPYSHGFWSALHTIGWNGKNWLKRLECISNVYTTIIVLGFIAVPLLFFVQSLMDSNFVFEYIKATLG